MTQGQLDSAYFSVRPLTHPWWSAAPTESNEDGEGLWYNEDFEEAPATTAGQQSSNEDQVMPCENLWDVLMDAIGCMWSSLFRCPIMSNCGGSTFFRIQTSMVHGIHSDPALRAWQMVPRRSKGRLELKRTWKGNPVLNLPENWTITSQTLRPLFSQGISLVAPLGLYVTWLGSIGASAHPWDIQAQRVWPEVATRTTHAWWALTFVPWLKWWCPKDPEGINYL